MGRGRGVGKRIAKVAIMGSVGRGEGNEELTICAKLAQAPADHLLKWGTAAFFLFLFVSKKNQGQ